MGFRGWKVEYDDGTVVYEGQIEWKEVKKAKISTLKLLYDGREWKISNKQGYLQKKKGSMVPGINESFRVESRSIGFYEGKDKVWYTVNEDTGMMKMSVEEG